MFRIASKMVKERQDVVGVNCLKTDDGNVIVEPEMVKKRWREYTERLMNVENDWDGVMEADMVEGPRERITEEEVKRTIRQMKIGKAAGPSGVVSEMLRAAGQAGIESMTSICNLVVEEGKVPKDWEMSRPTLIPIY